MKWFLGVVLVVSLSFSVLAQDSVNYTTRGSNFTAGNEPGNTTIEAGNVMNLGISAPNATANSWAGVFGNVTANFVVGKEESNPFFSWGLLDAEYVYASSQTLNFSGDWQSTNISYMKKQYPFLENGSEEASETFNSSNADIDSGFQSDPVNNTLAAYTYNDNRNPVWETMYISDGDGGFFAGPVSSGKSFNGLSADYQLILPEDGFSDGGTAYNMYLELK